LVEWLLAALLPTTGCIAPHYPHYPSDATNAVGKASELRGYRFQTTDADLTVGVHAVSRDEAEKYFGRDLTDLDNFRIAETGIKSDNTKICLSSETLGGQLFDDCDVIQTVPQ
jgi:hypothetical protein